MPQGFDSDPYSVHSELFATKSLGNSVFLQICISRW